MGDLTRFKQKELSQCKTVILKIIPTRKKNLRLFLCIGGENLFYVEECAFESNESYSF